MDVQPAGAGRPPQRPMPEALARTLRHEVGDFLQKVYATVAILRKRLPAEMAPEREVLDRLQSRAETCRQLLDDLQDFLCAMPLACEPTDLSAVMEEAVREARGQHPGLDIRAEASGPAEAAADRRRAAQVADALVANGCEAAAHLVRVQTRATAGGVEWLVTDDGPGLPADSQGRPGQPFFTTKAGHAGLGLALAERILGLHGGRLETGNRPDGGFQARAFFPADGPTA